MSKCVPVAAQPLFWVTTTGFPKTIGLKHGKAQITWSTSLRLANPFRAVKVRKQSTQVHFLDHPSSSKCSVSVVSPKQSGNRFYDNSR